MAALPLVFCALDTPDLGSALDLSAAMAVAGCGIKLGLEFFCAQGPQGVEKIRAAYPDLPLFLDLKFHDIPNTVAQAVGASCALMPDYMTLHAGGGVAMMVAARDAVDKAAARLGVEAPRLLAVTVLTSLDDAALRETGHDLPSGQLVLTLAAAALGAGMAGLVCAGPDIAPIRQKFGQETVLMVPGIRPANMEIQDQKRVMTPQQAMADGATHLVIGRPITGDGDPALAASRILAKIRGGDI